MSRVALAYSSPILDPRRAHALRKKRVVAPLKVRPWQEVTIDGNSLQTSKSPPPYIGRTQWIALLVVALAVHASLAWYLSQPQSARESGIRRSELNIEIVRPPKPVEPPTIEPPKPAARKPIPQQAQALPPILENDPLPTTGGDSSEASVAVAPAVTEAPLATEEVVTAPVGRAGYLNNPPPDYPAQAVKQGWQGNVLLRVRVLASGKVDSVEIKESSGRKVLDEEAIRTVKKWLFTPSKRGDTPIDGWATVPIEFVLDA